jgi:16S rRNA (uracil1498-N3)-methyltransferase
MARRRFFVDSVQRGLAQISGDDAHHLTRVLRVMPGQKYEISDNHSVYLAEVKTARKDLVSFEIVGQIDANFSVPRVTLLASLIKFDRFESMIEKATELGVERMIPIESERSEKGLAEAARKRRDRWLRIAREASEQARRTKLPAIDLPMSLQQALRIETDHRYMLDEGDASPILSEMPEQRIADDRVALLVGPEGGWTDRDRSAIIPGGWQQVSLGSNILRAETAAIAAIAILNAAWQAVVPKSQ